MGNFFFLGNIFLYYKDISFRHVEISSRYIPNLSNYKLKVYFYLEATDSAIKSGIKVETEVEYGKSKDQHQETPHLSILNVEHNLY